MSRAELAGDKATPCGMDIERVFNAVFVDSHNTILIGGAAEPYYQPADVSAPQHRIYYREDFVSSSLHEIAHWLVAGPERRLLPDWGYWYAPDGRDAAQQQQFERLEVKPQALEWLLHISCGLPFRVSLDNLGEHAGDGATFKDKVYAQLQQYLQQGVNDRCATLCNAFAAAFGSDWQLNAWQVSRSELDK
ncbi:MAG TPA: elongation factor P hydroxylase [Pseudomonadales bacterium]|nr:elongation factor P hydroxylase [Pseudomonadales bacterium]